mmetsp:Transcript_38511/g.39196  ORF Transcript_38511/g.39196 Transcript_38511/m.39196 type:complete len:236 (+) Transcript_38511:156-863(+)|eukprot:CAMPEP_0182417240 /NCGR_PEP_ID=MMETSP1167-20130531/1672_1 /TAXON_ID=2988 /ORGANISM="Mallomonas Sp, Strain CCMP3275" /LENGTH=235 /DNA_ID=CAMNT_0024590653 /DNA_START=154 /DNA_END=861 /DNA_ORIENTATION=+
MGCGASSRNEANDNSSPTVTGAAARSAPTRRITSVRQYRHGSPITQADIVNMRNDFWGSRVDGNAHMWNALRTAAEALLSQDFVLANAIVDASNITTPNGNLELCYDERGYEYKVPLYCYANPTEVVASTVQLDVIKKTPPKTPIVEKPLHLKIRVNPGDYNLQIDTSTTESIAQLKKQILDQTCKESSTIPICEESRQRIMFLGKELQNTQLLGDIGIDEARVVQVFLRPKKGS